MKVLDMYLGLVRVHIAHVNLSHKFHTYETTLLIDLIYMTLLIHFMSKINSFYT